MSCVDVVVECPVHDSFRVQQVAGMFGMSVEATSRAEFSVEIPGVEEPWQIGVIVGPSGSGKSTIARAAYGDALYEVGRWREDRAVVDCFGDGSIKKITQALTAVGLSSPPAWIRPYQVLSNGERFRCDLARALMSKDSLIVFDEFSSVVDRHVACVGSAAASKAIRSGKLGNRFVAVTCHYDVVQWLEPDWVVDMATCQLTRRRLRRPSIELQLYRCHHRAWRLFGRHHYMNTGLNKAAHCYLVTWNEEPVAFCAVLAVPGRKGAWRISRIVVLPDYQGIGIGKRVIAEVGRLYGREGRRLSITTSHPAMIAGLKRSESWRGTQVMRNGYRIQDGAKRGKLTGYVKNTSRGRGVVSFQYCGGCC